MIMGIISLIIFIAGVILTLYEISLETYEINVYLVFTGFILMGIGLSGSIYFIHVNIDIIRIWFTI